MERTRVETAGLIWHVLQMLVVVYLFSKPHQVVSGSVLVLVIPTAVGCWIAGLLQRPTPVALLVAAIYWALIAVDISTPLFSWAFSSGLSVDISFGERIPFKIDVLALGTTVLFLRAWRGRLTTRSSRP